MLLRRGNQMCFKFSAGLYILVHVDTKLSELSEVPVLKVQSQNAIIYYYECLLFRYDIQILIN